MKRSEAIEAVETFWKNHFLKEVSVYRTENDAFFIIGTKKQVENNGLSFSDEPDQNWRVCKITGEVSLLPVESI